MTIISHRHRFIFLKTRKTAGTSTEMWFADRLGPRDVIFGISEIEPLKRPFLTTMHQTTSLPGLERWLKLRLKKIAGWRAFAVHQHMTASEVKKLVGTEIWESYTTFCVERDPWDRFISYWRFMEHMEGHPIELDHLLDLVEAGEDGGMNANIHWWSNWPIYTIDGEIAVDRILRYENLYEELEDICGELGISFDRGLPRAKAGIRGGRDTVDSLTEDQRVRIAALFAREIAHFGYAPPRRGLAGAAGA